MKKRIELCIAAFLLFSLSACQTDSPPAPTDESSQIDVDIASPSPLDTVIVFEDPLIEEMVRHSLENPFWWKMDASLEEEETRDWETDDITVRDALKLESIGIYGEFYIYYFDAEGKTISTLRDLRWLGNLQELYLIDCGLTSLDGLEALENLEILDIRDNHVSDLSPLAGLTQLESIRCSNNALTDVSPLQNLTKLRKLDLYNNQITDLSPLAELATLDAVCVVGNPVSAEALDAVMRDRPNRYGLSETTMTVNPTLPDMIFQAVTYTDEDDMGYERIVSEYLRIINSQTSEVIHDIWTNDCFFEGAQGIVTDPSSIIFADINFDSYKDFKMYTGSNGNWNRFCQYFVWDVDANRFVGFSALPDSDGYLWSFDEEKQLVYAFARGSAVHAMQDTYQYMDGELICIEKRFRNSVSFLDGVTYEQITEIIPLISDDESPGLPYFLYYRTDTLNFDTMEMEPFTKIFELQVDMTGDRDWEASTEYDVDSDIGVKLSELVDWQITGRWGYEYFG